MGEIRQLAPFCYISAIFSADPAAIDWSINKLAKTLGEPSLKSELFNFDETAYYNQSMGKGIRKQLILFNGNTDPSELASIKLMTNKLEKEYAAELKSDCPRPVNIDPGYITLSKLILATTKDGSHRIYLNSGIFAEVTLYFRDGAWNPYPWTYPDYRHGKYFPFLNSARDQLLP